MTPTRNDQRAGCPGPAAFAAVGRKAARGKARAQPELKTSDVREAQSLEDLFANSLPSFGGAYLKRIWHLLDEAVGQGLPLTLAVAGPVSLSGQVHTWLGPLLDTGWFALVSTTDAVCYHDGHRALDGASKHPIHEVALFGDDGELREERTIRVTDIGFDEDVLLEQDRFLRALLQQPEFQRKLSGPEFRYLLGMRYAAQERQNGVREGLLALCARKAIPIFVGAPADGSVFLNSMALWALEQAGGREHRFELDLHQEVFESCAYHRWGLRESPTKALGTLILGGGVPKNFNLQPEPALSQILNLDDIAGYLYDIQLTTAPVTDGSLSSCPPAEAVTWGKVDKDHYKRTCESMQIDYTVVMPFLVKGLLEKRERFASWRERMGEQALFAKHPQARGYLRDPAGYRLYDQRERLVAALLADVRKKRGQLERGANYPLAPLSSVAGATAVGRGKAARKPPGSAGRKPKR